MPSALVVGAGPAAVAAARRLVERGGVDVTMVARDGQARHLPGTLAVALGQQPTDDFVTDLAIGEVRCLAGDVQRLDATGASTAGQHLASDVVIAAPGLELAPDAVPDWPAARAAWDLESAEAVAARLDAVPGGRLLIGVCSLPYRCPPAPYSLAMQLADRYRRSGRFTTVCVTTPEPFPLAGVGGEAPAYLMEACAGAGVQIERLFEIDLEKSENRVLRSRDGRELSYELALLIPPHRRSGALAELEGEGALVAVDERCESSVPGVYVAGDAAAGGLPRAAGVAEAQGRTAADAALTRLGLAEPLEPHLPEPSCYVAHGGGNLSRIRMTYPHGLPPKGEAEVTIEGPSPDLRFAMDADRRRFLDAAGGG